MAFIIWVRNRWSEPSTKIGLGIFAGAIINAVEHTPQSDAEWIKLFVVTISAVAGVTTISPGSPDKPTVK